MDRGQVDVAQPDVGEGGFTEAKRVCDMAADRGKLIVPHCWKTGIGIAALPTWQQPPIALISNFSQPIYLSRS